MAGTYYDLQHSNLRFAMKVALALACKELGISEKDQAKRATVATLMEPLAKTGRASINHLKSLAVSQFRMTSPH
jgi:hypothetical protein